MKKSSPHTVHCLMSNWKKKKKKNKKKQKKKTKTKMESRSKEQMGFDFFKNQNGEKVYVCVLFCLLFLELAIS